MKFGTVYVRPWAFCAGLVFGVTPVLADGVDMALEQCYSAPTYLLIDQCKASLRDTHYLSQEAVKVCNTAPTWNLLTACYQSIANRDYRALELKGCSSRNTWSFLMSCFAESGRRVPAKGADCR